MSVESKPGFGIATATEIMFRKQQELAKIRSLDLRDGSREWVGHIKMIEEGMRTGVISSTRGAEEIQKIIMAAQQASHPHSLGGGAVDTTGPSLPPMPIDVTNEAQRRAMICVRLRCTPQAFPFPMFNSYIGGETVFIAVMAGGELVTLKDDLALFPSDALMAQMRLLTP
jgi:hypothetical protein